MLLYHSPTSIIEKSTPTNKKVCKIEKYLNVSRPLYITVKAQKMASYFTKPQTQCLNNKILKIMLIWLKGPNQLTKTNDELVGHVTPRAPSTPHRYT